MKAYGVVRKRPQQLRTISFPIKTQPCVIIQNISPNQLTFAKKNMEMHELSKIDTIKSANQKKEKATVSPKKYPIFKNNQNQIYRSSHAALLSRIRQQNTLTPVKLLNPPEQGQTIQKEIHDKTKRESQQSTTPKWQRKNKIFAEPPIRKNQSLQKQQVSDLKNEQIDYNPEKQLIMNRSLKGQSPKKNSLRKTRIFEQFSPLKRSDTVIEKNLSNKDFKSQSKLIKQQQNELKVKASKKGIIAKRITIYTIQNIEPFTF